MAWSGPAVAELLKQFIVHNRMMTGGFVIKDQFVSLAELTCPILAFVGEVDDIGQPSAVRGIRRAAPTGRRCTNQLARQDISASSSVRLRPPITRGR